MLPDPDTFTYLSTRAHGRSAIGSMSNCEIPSDLASKMRSRELVNAFDMNVFSRIVVFLDYHGHLLCFTAQNPWSLLPKLVFDEIHMFYQDLGLAPLLPIFIFLGPAHLSRPSAACFLHTCFTFFLCIIRLDSILGLL